MITVLVCGSRNWDDQDKVDKHLDRVYNGYDSLHLIHGGAVGADSMSEIWARKTIHPRLRYISVHKADWAMYGKAAGPIRNKEMLDHLELRKPKGDTLVLAFRSNGVSNGTDNMISISRKAGFPVEIVYQTDPDENQLKLNFEN